MNFLPQTQTPWKEINKFRKKKFFFVAIFFALMASFLITKNFLEHRQQKELQKVYIAKQDLNAPTLLSSNSFIEKYIPNEIFPLNAIRTIEEIKGKTLLQDLSQNEIIVHQDITSEIDPSSITTKIPKGKQILNISELWFSSPLPNIGKNDSIDILAVHPKFRTNQVEFIATNIRVLQAINKSDKKIISLLVSDEEAKNITLARGLNLPMNIIINAYQ